MVGDVRGNGRGVIQRAQGRYYDRYGSRGLVVAAGLGTIASLWAVTVLICAASAGFLVVPFHEVVPYFWYGAIVSVLAVSLGVLTTWSDVRLVLEWSGENRTRERAVKLWGKGLTLPTKVTLRTAAALYAAIVFVMLPAAVVDFDLPLWNYPVMVVAWAFIVIAASVYFVLGLEVLFRPQLRDVATHLPQDFEPTVRGLSLRTKVSLPVPAAIMFAVFFATGFADTSESYGTRTPSSQMTCLVS